MGTSQLVYSTETYRYLRDRICELPGFEAGEIEHRRFPDGEHYRRIRSACTGRDVVLLGGTVSEEDTLALYDIACTLVSAGAHILTLVLPYYGYSTMERAAKSGEVVTAKTRASLFSSIPTAGSGNRVVLLDLHSEGTTHYFSGAIRPVHLSATPVVRGLVRELGGERFTVGATDAGRAKWVESLANDLDVPGAFVFKRRLSGSEVEVSALAADVRGQRVVLYDDMIRTGSSLVAAARAYLDAGATSIAAVATHGVFPDGSLERLLETGLFERIACTDTHPRAVELATTTPALRIESVALLLARCLWGTDA